MEVRMKTVCIVIGHSPSDGGCYNETLGMNEYDFNVVMAGQIAEKLHRRNVKPVVLYRDTYSGMIEDVNKTGADFALELHCNGVSDKGVKGSETLYWSKSVPSKRLAERLQKPIAALINQNNRGIKPIEQGGRGWRFLRYTNMPSVILEPFFISNDDSLEMALTLREQLANTIATALVEHVKGS